MAGKQTKFVVKKDGTEQELDEQKIRNRIDKLVYGLAAEYMGLDGCVEKVVKYAHSGIKTSELDSLLAETAAYLNMLHPDCGRLAARVAVTALHKHTKQDFSDVVEQLYSYVGKDGACASLIAEDVYQIIQANNTRINSYLDY